MIFFNMCMYYHLILCIYLKQTFLNRIYSFLCSTSILPLNSFYFASVFMKSNAEESCSTLGGSEHTRRSVSFSLKDNWRAYDGLDAFMLISFGSGAILLYTFSLLSLNVFQLFFFFFSFEKKKKKTLFIYLFWLR